MISPPPCLPAAAARFAPGVLAPAPPTPDPALPLPLPQGGPHNHTISGLACALKQATTPEFKAYQEQVGGGVVVVVCVVGGVGWGGEGDWHLMQPTPRVSPYGIVCGGIAFGGVSCAVATAQGTERSPPPPP